MRRSPVDRWTRYWLRSGQGQSTTRVKGSLWVYVCMWRTVLPWSNNPFSLSHTLTHTQTHTLLTPPSHTQPHCLARQKQPIIKQSGAEGLCPLVASFIPSSLRGSDNDLCLKQNRCCTCGERSSWAGWCDPLLLCYPGYQCHRAPALKKSWIDHRNVLYEENVSYRGCFWKQSGRFGNTNQTEQLEIDSAGGVILAYHSIAGKQVEEQTCTNCADLQRDIK